jgi:hypothetical protein
LIQQLQPVAYLAGILPEQLAKMTVEETFAVIHARLPAGTVKKPAEIEEKEETPMDTPENIAEKLKFLTKIMGGKVEGKHG